MAEAVLVTRIATAGSVLRMLGASNPMERAEELIRSSDLALPVTKSTLIKSLIPRIGFTSHAWMPRGLPLGASHFGGLADLPVGVGWPRVDGRPLLLLAQLNFADLPIERFHPIVKQLPERGWLCLFMDVGGDDKSIAALQFDGEAESLIRHDPEPAPDAETWSHCHAVTVCPADHHLCLPDVFAIDSPLPERDHDAYRDTYFELVAEVSGLARTHHEVTLLGSPTLFNPDPRRSLKDPSDWMMLLQFEGECSWVAGVQNPDRDYLSRPSLGSADFVQYFVRKSDYAAGRLNRGVIGWMLT